LRRVNRRYACDAGEFLPWAHFRETYGQAIESRELIKRESQNCRIDYRSRSSLQLGSHLLDNGYRGELECVIAKIFGSEAQKRLLSSCL